jgi:hypothetical protein
MKRRNDKPNKSVTKRVMNKVIEFRKCRDQFATHVRPPRPMDVKKLIENLEFLGLSLGNRPSKYTCKVL